jgi:hypothetical protein
MLSSPSSLQKRFGHRMHDMPTHLKGKHFITTQEWSVPELQTVFELARQLKRELLPDVSIIASRENLWA